MAYNHIIFSMLGWRNFKCMHIQYLITTVKPGYIECLPSGWRWCDFVKALNAVQLWHGFSLNCIHSCTALTRWSAQLHSRGYLMMIPKIWLKGWQIIGFVTNFSNSTNVQNNWLTLLLKVVFQNVQEINDKFLSMDINGLGSLTIIIANAVMCMR